MLFRTLIEVWSKVCNIQVCFFVVKSLRRWCILIQSSISNVVHLSKKLIVKLILDIYFFIILVHTLQLD